MTHEGIPIVGGAFEDSLEAAAAVRRPGDVGNERRLDGGHQPHRRDAFEQFLAGREHVVRPPSR